MARGRSSQAVTIKAVAERAGVSMMTVSNVINGRANVQATTRAAVQQAIKDLNYAPNAAARALATASSRLGLVYLNPQSAYLSSLLVGALNAASRLGAQMIIQKCRGHTPEAAVESLRALVRSGADGILLPAPFGEMMSGSPILAELGVPVVGVSPGEDLPDMPVVRIDDFAAAREMTALLARQGHRRIGFITGPSTHSASEVRRAGYAAALADANLAYDPALVIKGDFSFESGFSALAPLLSLAQPPSCIFASNDDMASGLVSAAHARRIEVPAALAIAGFDDTPIAVKIWPPLTTVRQPIAEMAEKAAERLIELIRSPSDAPGGATLVPFAIVERESTAGRANAPAPCPSPAT